MKIFSTILKIMLALTLCFTALDAIEEATKKDIVKLESHLQIQNSKAANLSVS